MRVLLSSSLKGDKKPRRDNEIGLGRVRHERINVL